MYGINGLSLVTGSVFCESGIDSSVRTPHNVCYVVTLQTVASQEGPCSTQLVKRERSYKRQEATSRSSLLVRFLCTIWVQESRETTRDLSYWHHDINHRENRGLFLSPEYFPCGQTVLPSKTVAGIEKNEQMVMHRPEVNKYRVPRCQVAWANKFFYSGG